MPSTSPLSRSAASAVLIAVATTVSCVLLLLPTTAHAVPIPMSALASEIQTQYNLLSQAGKATANEQLAAMGSYDPATTKLDNTGRFFFVENAADASQDPAGGSSGSSGALHRRMISDANPSGYDNG